MSSESDKLPRVVVLGGCGFIGRNVVEYLVSEGLAGAVRVVDKTPPQTAWLSPRHSAIFSHDVVEFRSANLINPASCAEALEPSEAGAGWDVVVNCAAETRPGLADAVYEQGVVALGLNVAAACMRARVQRLVEISSSHIYPTDKSSHSEESACAGWTACGRYKLQLERELAALGPQLRYTVLRPALVYGPADTKSLTPRVLVGAVYKQLGERLRLLWSRDLRLSTVHVRDVARATWFVSRRDDTLGRAYNVADEADTTHGALADLVSELFGVTNEFVGNALSLLAKSELSALVEEANDKHLVAWARACAAGGVTNTPLEPTAHADSLLDRHLALDTSALRHLGFVCSVPAPTAHHIREVLEEFVEMRVFPKTLLL